MNHSFIQKAGEIITPTEETGQQLYGEQRAKILDGARRAFARKGRKATMADVATEAGVSQGLAYRYFVNKEAIFRALIEQALRIGPGTVSRMQEIPGTPGERLAVVVTKLVENRREHPEFHQLLNQVLNDNETPGELRELVDKRMQALRGPLRELIVEGQATGEVAADDPDQLITAFFSCLLGLSRWAVYDAEQFHFPDTTILLRLFMSGSR